MRPHDNRYPNESSFDENMLRMTAKLVQVMCVVVLMTILGCGKRGNADRPPTVPVQGVVTYKGQPVEGASVSFQRTDRTKSAVGRTDAHGKYFLTTFEPGDGAMTGEYDVKIVKYEQPKEEPEDGVTPPLKSLIPEKYAKGVLKATVQDGGDNTFDFDLQ